MFIRHGFGMWVGFKENGCALGGIRLRGKLQKWFDDKGYGFIKADDGRRLFVHNWDIYGIETIQEKQRMEFKIKQTEKGLKAIYVKIIK